MEVPAFLLTLFPPSSQRLLDEARADVDDAMLMVIAAMDYGQDADEMFVWLRAIKDSGEVPLDAPWLLGEVLSLTRYSNPDSRNEKPEMTGEAGYRTLLFACSVLLKWIDHFNSTLDQYSLAKGLISAGRLGPETNAAFGSFLTKRLLTPPRVTWPPVMHSRALYAISLLIAASRLPAGSFSPEDLMLATEWVMALESDESYENPDPCFYPLADELNAIAATYPEGELRTNLQVCAVMIEDDRRYG